MLIGSDVYFAESQASRRQELGTGAGEAMPASQPAYSTEARSTTYPGSVYPSGSITPGDLGSVRPSTNDSNYTYGYEYTNPAPTYPSAGGNKDPREGARTYSYAGPRDNILDPRDLRLDPRDPRMDPRDPRLDTRLDPRTIPSYPSYVSSPGDVSWYEAVGDPGACDYILIPSLQSVEVGSSTPSGVVPRGYNPRDAPQRRDGYRIEHIWEERGFSGNLPMQDIKKSRSGHVAGDTHRSEPVGEKHKSRPVQGFGGQSVERDRCSVPKLHSKEDLLQPSAEKSDATPDEESERSGITSLDDNAVR